MLLTIIGSGMSNYSLESVASRINLNEYDAVFMDTKYSDNESNDNFLMPIRELMLGDFSFIRATLVDRMQNNKNANYLYVVTGSPLFYSGCGVILKKLVGEIPDFSVEENAIIIDNTSSLSYILSKRGIDSNKVGCMSMHGRTKIDIESLFKKEYTFILSDDNTLHRMKNALEYLTKDDYTLTLGSRLGYPDEKISTGHCLDEFLNIYNPEQDTPYVIMLQRHFTPSIEATPDDEFFSDGGMITKSFKRAITIADLELKPNMLLWDVGAGSGSISIDAYKKHRVSTVLFEKNGKRVSDIKKNLTKHKVVGCKVIDGDVLETSKTLTEKPDRIFIGGGGVDVSRNIMYFFDKMSDDGIILINYVTLDYIHNVLQTLRDNNIKFEVRSISLTTFKDINILISEPERLMFQIKIYKNNKKGKKQ